ncbi:hypothetical protein M405DRAFT_834922, partial [Rhizopogon salebrosus TDB-379]
GVPRTELIAQKNSNHTALNAIVDVGTTVFHVSIQEDPAKPLNLSHEYQVWIEPNDGSHIFEIQLGSPFTIPTGTVPLSNTLTRSLKVRSHALTLLFETPMIGITSRAPSGVAAQGDYHFGVLKLPLANPNETAAQQSDVVHFGIQEGDAGAD